MIRAAIVGLGRWGRWEHMNSDVAVSEALSVAASLRLGEAVGEA